VSELHERTGAPDGPPAGPRRRRVALIVLACVAIAAVVSVLVVALGGGSGSNGTGSTASSATAQPQSGIALDPSQRLDTEAAVRNGWTLIEHDEFDGDELDEDKWAPYSGKTTDDVGQHDPDNITVSDGTVKLTSRDDKTSAGMWWKSGHKYGRWEARVRSEAGNGYGPVMLLWPESGDWPEDGEIDIMEIPKGDRTKAHFTVHWGEDNEQDAASATGDFTQWHNFAVEWTPDHIIGYLDGVEFYRNEDGDAQPPGEMHFVMQQDIGPYGTDWIPAPDASTPSEVSFEADWVRVYAD
jgi:beta-glucanase (GH16 family)